MVCTGFVVGKVAPGHFRQQHQKQTGAGRVDPLVVVVQASHSHLIPYLFLYILYLTLLKLAQNIALNKMTIRQKVKLSL
jgi:hypothetical protein